MSDDDDTFNSDEEEVILSNEDDFPLSDTDRFVLSTPEHLFVEHDWRDLKEKIRDNELADLRRRPSDLRRYMNWTMKTIDKYGSVTNYLLARRLPKAWGSPPFVPASSTPFADPSDYRVLINDWPYGVKDDITHFVVWTRTPIPINNRTGDLTPGSRALIAAWVQEFFEDRLEEEDDRDTSWIAEEDLYDRVLWFKNWSELQSVRQLEHIHVLVHDAPDKLLVSWTKELPCHRVDPAWLF